MSAKTMGSSLVRRVHRTTAGGAVSATHTNRWFSFHASLWRPQLAVRHKPSLWAPTRRAPLEKPIVLPNSASEVVVNDYIRPPVQQQRADAVQEEEDGGDLICAECTVVALGFVLVWLYLAISANYRKGRSLAPMKEYSTLEAEERKAEIMPRALEATAWTESTAPHLVFNTSEQQGFVILTAAV
ncbi:hypothetical protein MRX96_004581 [Rhipicephalus microplus]